MVFFQSCCPANGGDEVLLYEDCTVMDYGPGQVYGYKGCVSVKHFLCCASFARGCGVRLTELGDFFMRFPPST